MPAKATLSGYAVEKVVRLSKTALGNAAYTLDLEISISGSDIYSAAWTIETASVPSWLSLPRQGSIGATEKTGNLSITVSSDGMAERLATPYEALLNLSVTAQYSRLFLVSVQLYVSARTVAHTSSWGRSQSWRLV